MLDDLTTVVPPQFSEVKGDRVVDAMDRSNVISPGEYAVFSTEFSITSDIVGCYRGMSDVWFSLWSSEILHRVDLYFFRGDLIIFVVGNHVDVVVTWPGMILGFLQLGGNSYVFYKNSVGCGHFFCSTLGHVLQATLGFQGGNCVGPNFLGSLTSYNVLITLTLFSVTFKRTPVYTTLIFSGRGSSFTHCFPMGCHTTATLVGAVCQVKTFFMRGHRHIARVVCCGSFAL